MYMKNLEQELKENAYPAAALLSVKAKTEKQLSLLILSWGAVQTAVTVFLWKKERASVPRRLILQN